MKSPALLIGFEGGKPSAEPDAGGDTRALAGTALAKALKSGDGAAIADAVEALLTELQPAEEEAEDPLADGPEAA